MRLLFIILLLIIDVVITQDVIARWSRPRVTVDDDSTYSNFANDFGSYNDLSRVVYFDFCDSPAYTDNFGASIVLTFKDAGFVPGQILATKESKGIYDEGLETIETTDCKVTWKAPREGNYHVGVAIFVDKQRKAFVWKTVPVQDIWITAFGDSYVSGEGNPDIRGGFLVLPKWISLKCDRSAKGSFAYLTYDNIAKKYPKHGILFTYLACSGAAVNTGLLGAYLGEPPQVKVVEDIQAGIKKSCCTGCCKTVPDVVILGIGGNDIQFETVVKSFLVGLASPQYAFIPKRLTKLRGSLALLNKEFKKIGIAPNSVFYIQYYDPLHNSNGVVDSSCKKAGLATSQDFQKAKQEINAPLDVIMKNAAKQYRWTFVEGVRSVFKRHGLCADDSYIRTIEDSIVFQGTVRGAFHPTYKGHRETAKVVWKYVGPYVTKKFGKPLLLY